MNLENILGINEEDDAAISKIAPYQIVRFQ